ncbi:MAG: hypothetical protein R3E32_26925 [Chitinophagales bacterium]
MTNFNLIPFANDEESKSFVIVKGRFTAISGIRVDILEYDNTKQILKVRAEQVVLKNTIRSSKRICESIMSLFQKIRERGIMIHIVALTFKPDFSKVTSTFIKEKIARYDIKQVDLVYFMGLDKTTISLHLKGERLTNYTKAAYFYLFRVFDRFRAIQAGKAALERSEKFRRGEEIDRNKKTNWIPLDYQPNFDIITAAYIREQKKKYEIKNKDLVKQMGLDKSTMSLIVNGGYKLTKPIKAAFFHYFYAFQMSIEDLENYTLAK